MYPLSHKFMQYIYLDLSRTTFTWILTFSRSNAAFRVFYNLHPSWPHWTLWWMTSSTDLVWVYLGFSWLSVSLIESSFKVLKSPSQGHSRSASWLTGWVTKVLGSDTWHRDGIQEQYMEPNVLAFHVHPQPINGMVLRPYPQHSWNIIGHCHLLQTTGDGNCSSTNEWECGSELENPNQLPQSGKHVFNIKFRLSKEPRE